MKRYLVKPGSRLRLADADPDDHSLLKDKDEANEETPDLQKKLDELHTKLYANKSHSLLIVLQGMDTSGKDGTIRHVMSSVSPQSCSAYSFRAPTPEEAAHDFLWRLHSKTPAKGYTTIFNRSHYEDVVVTRVHRLISDKEAEKRMKHIRHFEKLLASSGTTILKFFLNISKGEQRERLAERLEDSSKLWKFNALDIAERKKWKAYQKAYEEALSATSVEHAPWYVVPANHKWYRNWVVASIIVQTLESMNLKWPAADASLKSKKSNILRMLK